ncbi:MAG: class I SAM-dependent methyltransferase [Acidimicrobiales bacterium]
MKTPQAHTVFTDYVAKFHDERPGITEAILSRSKSARGLSPYQWLLESLPLDQPMLDLACGSSPLAGQARSTYVGIDRSRGELTLARGQLEGSEAGMVIQGNAVSLPFGDSHFESIACSMAMMVLTPLEEIFGELARVATPTGNLALLLPARTPLNAEDLWWYGATKIATGALRFATPPSGGTTRIVDVAATHGFTVRSRMRERFELCIDSEEVADLIVHSWYLPTTTSSQAHRAKRVLRLATGRSLGIPLERITMSRR